MSTIEIDWGDDDDIEGSPRYLFDDADQALLQMVADVLHRATLETRSTWAQKASIAKLLHLMTRLPAVSDVMNIEISFISPRQSFNGIEVHFWLTVQVDVAEIAISYQGHYFDPAHGGDTFTAFRCECSPGEDSQWRTSYPQLSMVPGLRSLDDVLLEMMNSLDTYTIDVIDHDNPLLESGEDPSEAFIRLRFGSPASEASAHRGNEPGVEVEVFESDDEDAEGDDVGAPVKISPVSHADSVLLATIGLPALSKMNLGSAGGVEQCDGCGLDLSKVGFFVDGNAPQSGWGNYCAGCTLQRKVTIVYGRGQLYARQPNGEWYGVAGF